jgi:hypothetical protein
MEKRLQAMIDAANTVKPALNDFYGSLTALLEIIRNIHCHCLVVDRAPNVRLQMHHLTLDVQAFAVGIED